MFNGRYIFPALRRPLFIDYEQFAGIASGIAYLHVNEIVHGDIKMVRDLTTRAKMKIMYGRDI